MRDDDDATSGDPTADTGRRKGRKPKSGVNPLTHAQRQRDYRRRRARRLYDAYTHGDEVPLVTLLDALQQLTRSGKHPALIHQVLDAIGARFPLPEPAPVRHGATTPAAGPPMSPDRGGTTQAVALRIWVPVENGSKFTRGKKRAREDIADMIRGDYAGTALSERDFRVEMSYTDEVDLKKQIDDLISDIWHLADLRNCIAEDVSVKNEATGEYWNDYQGGWR